MSDRVTVTGAAPEFEVGQRLPELAFPLSVYRLVVEAGANRDFNSIHHNSEFAQASGAPEMYANTLFLQGMWERAVRDAVGPTARFLAMHDFRMRRFTVVGQTAVVRGRVVAATSNDDGERVVTFELTTYAGGELTVGPGTISVAFPRGAGAAC